MSLVSVLCWPIPCPILAHIHHCSYWTSHFFLSGLTNELQTSSIFFNCSITISDFQVKSQPTQFFACTSYLCSCLLLQRSLYTLNLQLSYIPAIIYIGAHWKILSPLWQKGILQTAITFGRERMTSKLSAARKRHSPITYTTVLSGYCL